MVMAYFVSSPMIASTHVPVLTVKRNRLCFFAAVCAVLTGICQTSAQVNYSGGSYQQSFDSLPATGTSISWVDNSTLPGWYAWISSLNSPPGTINVDVGTSTTSTVLHDYGLAGSTNRALGLYSYSTTELLVAA